MPVTIFILSLVIVIELIVLAILATLLLRKNKLINLGKNSLQSLVKAIISIVESKDDYTAKHHRNVANLSLNIAKKMNLPAEKIETLYNAALIHDIGKICIDEEVLNKNTRLNASELEQIRSHPLIGYNIIKNIYSYERIAEIILQHHERNNGSGYPNKLVDNEIILEAKILSVADTFEAMTSKRPYGSAMPIEKAIEVLEEGSGKLFDENVVKACKDLFLFNTIIR